MGWKVTLCPDKPMTFTLQETLKYISNILLCVVLSLLFSFSLPLIFSIPCVFFSLSLRVPLFFFFPFFSRPSLFFSLSLCRSFPPLVLPSSPLFLPPREPPPQCGLPVSGHLPVSLSSRSRCSCSSLPAAGESQTVTTVFFLVCYSYIFIIVDCVQHQYIPVNFRRPNFWWLVAQYLFMFGGSLLVVVCLSFFLLGSWDFLSSVYGFMSVILREAHQYNKHTHTRPNLCLFPLQSVCPRPNAEYRTFLVLFCGDVWALPSLLPLRFSDQRLLLHNSSVPQTQVGPRSVLGGNYEEIVLTLSVVRFLLDPFWSCINWWIHITWCHNLHRIKKFNNTGKMFFEM